MDENRQHHGAREEEDANATNEAATPLFDDEATQVAQPVVPLTAEAAAVAAVAPPFAASREEVLTVVNSSQNSGPRFYGVGEAAGVPVVAARRSWLLTLIVISVLVGSVLGGVGLRLYQKRQATKTVEASSVQEQPQEAQAAPIVEEATAQQQPVAPPEEATDAQESDAQTAELPSEDTPTVAEEDSQPQTTAAAAPRREDDDDDDDARSQVAAPRKARPQAAESRVEDDDNDRRGRRDGRDDDARPRGEVRARRVNDPEADYIEREARRIRRLERQRQRQARSVDSLRGIFEGGP
jgi:hypothetical protein